MWPRVARFLGQSRPFWTWLLDHWRRPPHTLGHAVAEAQALLRADGLDVDVLRTVPMFGELSVSNGDDTCIVDLVAEPFPPIAPPQRATIEDAEILVDSRHEILVSKLPCWAGASCMI